MLEDQDWFSSHGEPMPMSEFLYLEVEDRGNYTQEEVDAWWEQYDIGLMDNVIWVTGYDNCKERYCEDGCGPVKVEVRHIIEESNDGDGGYLAVL